MIYHNYYKMSFGGALMHQKSILFWFVCLIYLLRVEAKQKETSVSFLLIMQHVIKYANTHAMILTCEVAQAQLPQAVVPVPPVVEEDGQRVATLVQFGASDDP